MAPSGAPDEPTLFFFLFIFITACSAALQLHALRVPDDRSWRRLGHVGTLRNVLFCLSWARIPRGSFQAAWERMDRTYGVKIPIYAPLLEVIVILSYGILFVLFVLDLLATMPARLIITAIRNLRVSTCEHCLNRIFMLCTIGETFRSAYIPNSRSRIATPNFCLPGVHSMGRTLPVRVGKPTSRKDFP